MLDHLFFLKSHRAPRLKVKGALYAEGHTLKPGCITPLYPDRTPKPVTLRRWAVAICCWLLACLLGSLVVLCFQVSRAVQDADRQLTRTLGTISEQAIQLRHQATRLGLIGVNALGSATIHANATLDAATTTLNAGRLQAETIGLETSNAIRQVTAPCVPGPCGTLADVNKTLNTARGTMGQVEIAVHHEAKNLDLLNEQEEQLVADVHHTLGSVNEDVQATHALLTDPHIPPMIAQVSETTGTVQHMLQIADAVETKATSSYLHPSKNPLVRGFRYVSPFLVPGAQIAAIAAK